MVVIRDEVIQKMFGQAFFTRSRGGDRGRSGFTCTNPTQMDHHTLRETNLNRGVPGYEGHGGAPADRVVTVAHIRPGPLRYSRGNSRAIDLFATTGAESLPYSLLENCLRPEQGAAHPILQISAVARR